MAIIVSNFQEDTLLDDALESLAERAVEETLAAEGRGDVVEVSVAFVDDEYMHRLNKNYRGIDRTTDVLAFPMNEEDPGAPGEEPHLMLGDIVISLPAAQRQAAEYGVSLEQEVARLAVHGALHLLGYDHEKGGEEAERMRERENEILERVIGKQ
ncbi:MAG: rRNA maturation RNase YbeY [Peptococcaceae bacterium]|nr:rRNA maturation RNase YbeY [Peptococcaceae bacterium]